MDEFIKGYLNDAAVDIVMEEDGVILPGFSRIKLPAHYTPVAGEAAVVCSRTSTVNAGILAQFGIIDADYTGQISAFVFNASGMNYEYKKGDRLFSVINLQVAPIRVKHKIENKTIRGKNKIGSTGGHSND